MPNSANSKLRNEAAQMMREVPDNLLGDLYRRITSERKLLFIPQKYIKKLRQTKDLLSVYFEIVLDPTVKKEHYELFIPTVHEILLELGQTPPKQTSNANTIASVEELFEAGSSSAQTTDPVAVYREIKYFAPRIDEALAAVGLGDRVEVVEANFRTQNNNNNNNNNGAANNNGSAANAGTAAGKGGRRKTRRRKTKKSRKQSR